MTTYRIYITDPHPQGHGYNQEAYEQMDQWAQVHCESYTGYSVTEVSDVSTQWDEVGEYIFREERDALVFSLKFK